MMPFSNSIWKKKERERGQNFELEELKMWGREEQQDIFLIH